MGAALGLPVLAYMRPAWQAASTKYFIDAAWTPEKPPLRITGAPTVPGQGERQ
jgi:hypothetical protein